MSERLILLSLLFVQPSMVSPAWLPAFSVAQSLTTAFLRIPCHLDSRLYFANERHLKGAGEKAEFILLLLRQDGQKYGLQWIWGFGVTSRCFQEKHLLSCYRNLVWLLVIFRAFWNSLPLCKVVVKLRVHRDLPWRLLLQVFSQLGKLLMPSTKSSPV